MSVQDHYPRTDGSGYMVTSAMDWDILHKTICQEIELTNEAGHSSTVEVKIALEKSARNVEHHLNH